MHFIELATLALQSIGITEMYFEFGPIFAAKHARERSSSVDKKKCKRMQNGQLESEKESGSGRERERERERESERERERERCFHFLSILSCKYYFIIHRNLF